MTLLQRSDQTVWKFLIEMTLLFVPDPSRGYTMTKW